MAEAADWLDPTRAYEIGAFVPGSEVFADLLGRDGGRVSRRHRRAGAV